MAGPESIRERAARRLRHDGWRLRKAAAQRLARLADPAMPKLTVFVSGLQRSGTNMLMEAFERSPQTQVFKESDPRAFERYHMREPQVIHNLVERSPARAVVVKALLEGDRLRQLLDEFAPAKAVWMFRHVDDVVNSNMANWAGGRNQIDDIVVDRNSADWRGRGMTDESHALVVRHYQPAMNDASALGLFYYYRHQLFFDQGLDADPRVCLMNYEELVSAPARAVAEIAGFCDLAPDPRMWARIHKRSVKRAPSPDITPDIHALTDAMYDRLQETRRAKAAPRTEVA